MIIIRRLPVAAAIAVLGGLVFDVASPDLSIWPAAFAAVALMLIAQWGRGFWAGVLLGTLSGAAFWMPNISWLTLYLGPIPWAALAGFMILWFALFGGATALATRTLGRKLQKKPKLSVAALTVVVAALWVAREQIAGSWPYGGFAWGRIAVTQSDSPLGSLASWLGFGGMGFVMVAAVACTIAICTTYGTSIRNRATLVNPARIAVIIPSVAIIVLMVVPAYSLQTVGTAQVAAVQGNSDSAIFSDRRPGDSLNSHFEATLPIIDTEVDFVVWPENAADLSPTRVPESAELLDKLSEQMGVPFVVGTITKDGDKYFNSSVVWEAGKGVTAQYDKKHPVPFAEYMPNREFFHAIVPDLVDLVQLEYSRGERPATIRVGDFRAGISICFDIVDDELAREMVDENAEFILAQTNNADFGRTDENLQQLAITQLRAIETGRPIVNISTVGTSAIILPDGSITKRLEPFTADTMVSDIPRVVGSTPAMVIGQGLTTGITILGYLGFAGSLVLLVASLFARKRTTPTKG